MLEGLDVPDHDVLGFIAESGIKRMTGFAFAQAGNVSGQKPQWPRARRRVALTPVEAEPIEQAGGRKRRLLVQSEPQPARQWRCPVAGTRRQRLPTHRFRFGQPAADPVFIMANRATIGVAIPMPRRALAAGGAFFLLVSHRPHAGRAMPQRLEFGGIQRPVQLGLNLGEMVSLQILAGKWRR